MEATCKQFRKRNAILACLRASREHPSAEAIFARLKPEYPDLSLGTVYRNLSLFREQGLVASVGTVGGVERFDGETAPHAHFICTRCGAVTDLMGLEVPDSLLSDAALHSGGTVERCCLRFSGVCRACTHTAP